FDFTGANLKGNGGLKFQAQTGDSLWGIYDGTLWNCLVQHVAGGSLGASNGVSQSTNKGTSVTNDYVQGQITLNNANLNATTTVSFTFSNNKIIAASDQMDIAVIGGAADPTLYKVEAI